MSKISDKDDDDEESSKGCLIKSSSSESKNHVVYFSDTILSSEEYFGLLEILAKANESDTVTIYLSGYGGQADAGVKLINHIRNSDADVSIIVDAPVYSMHAILAFATRYPQIESNVFFMFHDMSVFNIGKNSEVYESSVHAKDYSLKLLKDVCGHVLTKKEIVDITDGKDLYLNGDEVLKRMAKHAEIKNKNEV